MHIIFSISLNNVIIVDPWIMWGYRHHSPKSLYNFWLWKTIAVLWPHRSLVPRPSYPNKKGQGRSSTLCKVAQMHDIIDPLHPPDYRLWVKSSIRFAVGWNLEIQRTNSTFIEKCPLLSGLTQFKPTVFKGQLEYFTAKSNGNWNVYNS